MKQAGLLYLALGVTSLSVSPPIAGQSVTIDGAYAVDIQGALATPESTLSVSGLQISNLGSANLGLDGDVVPYGGSVAGFDLGNNISGQ